jgi:hypothetical protein
MIYEHFLFQNIVGYFCNEYAVGNFEIISKEETNRTVERKSVIN